MDGLLNDKRAKRQSIKYTSRILTKWTRISKDKDPCPYTVFQLLPRKHQREREEKITIHWSINIRISSGSPVNGIAWTKISSQTPSKSLRASSTLTRSMFNACILTTLKIEWARFMNRGLLRGKHCLGSWACQRKRMAVTPSMNPFSEALHPMDRYLKWFCIFSLLRRQYGMLSVKLVNSRTLN